MTPPPTPRKRIGEMLLDAGIIDETQLKAALGHQRQWGVRLGQALVDLKLATEADIVEALSRKYGFEIARIGALEPYAHEQALKLFPREFAVRNNVFPMSADTASVTVAMSDPSNLAVVDEIRFRTGRRVKVCIGGDREVADAVKRHYPGDAAVEAIALDLDADAPEGEAVFDPFGGGSKDALEAFFGGGPEAAQAAVVEDAGLVEVPAPVAAPAAAVTAPVSAPAARGPAKPPPAKTQSAIPAQPARPLAPPAQPASAAPAPAPHRGPAAPAPATARPAQPPAAPAPRPAAARAAAAVPARPPPELELEEHPAVAAARGAGAAPAAPPPDPPAPADEGEVEELTPFGEVTSSHLLPGDAPAAAGPDEARELSDREIAILEALDRLAGGGHAEPEIVKPAQAMAAMIRLLIRKRIVTDQEFLDELTRR